ncbi:MAG: histidine phosphatase family protein [Clostridia bacterium]|jgi:alpha-ribazole phosphatase|nr:histidine phosphatase family protein [Clostridia bacterium]MBQ2274475.1 histidine phosphatase family protein [Clostridia bacterium]MBQ5798844.1 histidine phosphatase family protein [Clostridia bacterium]MBQ5901227.1 histidine phosphatase family protein [Clostridia bacterium]MEE1278846.1 histidine phosphatase family protein [Acutalibacteraceae bacterium]
MRSYKLHLIRHGATDANKEGRYIGGKTDLPLSQEGKREVKNLYEDFVYPRVPLVFSSPMERCVQTAKILFPAREITTIENLREYNFGDFENKTATELDGRPDYAAWAAGKMPSPPNGESSKDFVARTVLGINEIIRIMMEKQEYEASVVMHGGAIMMLLAACGLPRQAPAMWTSDNGKGYTILITPSLYQKTGAFEVVNLVPGDVE